MPQPALQPHNVPLIGPLNRSGIIGVNSRWISQVFDSGLAPTGVRPQTATTNADQTIATIKRGQVFYGDPDDNSRKLTVGGLFSELGNNGVPLVLEAVSLPGVTTFDLVDEDDNVTRNVTVASIEFPFVIAPFEYIKLTSGDAGESFAFLLRLQGTRIL